MLITSLRPIKGFEACDVIRSNSHGVGYLNSSLMAIYSYQVLEGMEMFHPVKIPLKAQPWARKNACTGIKDCGS